MKKNTDHQNMADNTADVQNLNDEKTVEKYFTVKTTLDHNLLTSLTKKYN